MGSPSFLSRVVGRYYAPAYAYGLAGGPAPFRVASTTASGTVTITTQAQQFSLNDGRVSTVPFGIYAPIQVGIGATQETVTPTAVSFVASPSSTSGGGYWNITAAFSNAHSQGEPIASGSFGVQEAAMDAAANGGGVVVIDSVWKALGGTLTKLVAFKSVNADVSVVDNFTASATGAFSYVAAAGSVYVVTTYHQY